MKNALKYIIASTMNIFLRVPFMALEYIFYGTSEFFRIISEGFHNIQMSIRPMTIMPFVKGWDRQIKEEKSKERIRLLNKLRQSTNNH